MNTGQRRGSVHQRCRKVKSSHTVGKLLPEEDPVASISLSVKGLARVAGSITTFKAPPRRVIDSTAGRKSEKQPQAQGSVLACVCLCTSPTLLLQIVIVVLALVHHHRLVTTRRPSESSSDSCGLPAKGGAWRQPQWNPSSTIKEVSTA
jgi:hypothetical protein